MPGIVFQPFWQQKHPTPSHAGWDFHVHPHAATERVQPLVAEMDVRQRGGSGASAWLVAEDAVVWVRTFSAFATSEQRQYIGVTGVIATPHTPADRASFTRQLPAIFEALSLPEAEPFTQGTNDAAATRSLNTMALARVPVETLADVGIADVEQLISMTCAGGTLGALHPNHASLPALVGRLLTWLPESTASAPRHAYVVPLARARADAAPVAAARNLYHYLASAAVPRPPLDQADAEFAARAWRLVLDLARTSGAPLDELFRDLTAVADAWGTATALGDYVKSRGTLQPDEIDRCDRIAPAPLFANTVPDAGWLWNRIVHYWGRGYFGDGAVLDRLARLLAFRVVVDHLYRLDHPDAHGRPWRHIGRLYFESLLTGDRRAVVAQALAQKLPSLFQRGAP